MAVRPVFQPRHSTECLVLEQQLEFLWHKGMAPSQRRKNVAELHTAAAKRGLKALEVSTRSDEELGRQLSAFNVKVEIKQRFLPFECVYQGSKVFADGGPFVDLYDVEPKQAKTDKRLMESGPLVRFQFEEREYPLVPTNAFYDWLYVRSLYPRRDELTILKRFDAFTDISFNPQTSLNCQARSCAMFVALDVIGLLDEAAHSFDFFITVLTEQKCFDSIDQPTHTQMFLFNG